MDTDATHPLTEALGSASVDALAERTGISRRSLYRYRSGDLDPPLGRAADIAAALGLELYIGPPRDSEPPAPVAPAPAPAAPDIGSARAGESAPAPLPIPVRDRALAELLTAVVRRWESLPPAERGYLVADLWAAGGSGLRAQGSVSPRHIVAWLGWRVIEGSAAASKKNL